MINIHGKVEDEKGKALQFATIKLLSDNQILDTKSTLANGQFDFNISNNQIDSLILEVSYVNKATQRKILEAKDYTIFQRFVLSDLSLTLNDVKVTSVLKNQNSASSIVFDEEAIKQLQAFSLMDVLNTLPGKKTEPPNLQSPQTVTFRSSSTLANSVNNSFGIAIFIDGIRISNETDMQSRGLSSRGGTPQLSAQGQPTMDVTYNGFDLRDIPMSNIASIEIIQGVGNSRYGDFTNGAILITTKAGKTPYSLTTNINGGSSSFSLSKGFDLGKKNGALNVSLGYTNSNDDPRDKLKSYNNANFSIRWSKALRSNINNSLSISGATNFDDIKQDPDDDARVMSYSKRRNFRLSNITDYSLNKKLLEKASLSLSYSYGVQYSYSQFLMNQLPKGIGYKDTTGVYEGYFVPGSYLAVEEIDGKPISYSANLDMQSTAFKAIGLLHKFSYGFSFDGSGNIGKGYIVNPNTPRWLNENSQNERPYSYKDSVKFVNNIAFYFQDNVKGRLFGKSYNIGLGFRYNRVNSQSNMQPRASFNYTISRAISLSSSFGITYKSPSLAHLYPSPTYFDIPLLNLYDNNVANSVYLVYTKKVLAENQHLKSTVTYQFEQGVNLSFPLGSGSIFAYYKKNKNGFNSFTEFIPTAVPVYKYSYNEDSMIHYFPTGDSTTQYNLQRNRMNNGLESEDIGFDFTFQSKIIEPIATSIAVRGGYTFSKYNRGNRYTFDLASTDAQQQGIAYVLYIAQLSKNKSSLYNITTTTHIPQIGFVFNIIADYQPISREVNDAKNIYPVGYTRKDLTYVALTEEEGKSDAYAYLRKNTEDGNGTTTNHSVPSKGFWTLNMRIAKEIRKKIRLSLSAFNVFNMKKKAYTITSTNGAQGVNYYNYKPVSITIGASLQL